MRYGALASKLASLFLLGLAVWLIWWAMAPITEKEASREAPQLELLSQHPARNRQEQALVDKISTWNLFGPASVADAHNVADVPLATKSYGLLGVISNVASQSGWAILQADAGYDVVASTEKITDGVVLKSVHENYAIIEDRGALKKVPLPPFEEMEIQTVGSELSEPSDTSLGSPDDDSNKSEASKVRERMIAGMNLKPIEKGAAKGYVVAKNNKELEEKFGLKEGDKILSASGFPLGTEADDLMAVEAFKASGSASILIEKADGTQMTIAYPP